MSNGFSRSDIKSWFAQTLYEDFETSKPRKRRATGILTEATDDGRDDRVDNYDEYLGMISQALVLGLETLFGLDIDEKKEYDLGQDFRQILEKNPDVTNSIARYFEHYRMGDNLVSDDESAGAVFGMPGDKPEADSGDKSDYYREEILRQVGSEVYNSMDSISLKRDDLRRLIDDMIAAGRFTREEFDASGVNFVDVVEKVEDFEREYGDDPPPRY